MITRMDDSHMLPAFWTSGSSDFWLSGLIGLLATISLSNIALGTLAAVFVYSLLKYATARDAAVEEGRDVMVRLPVQAL